MNYRFILAAVAAVAAMTSCNKNDNTPVEMAEGQNEISFFNSAEVTKGYVTGSTFFDTEIAELHKTTPTITAREMQISAYLTPQSGEAKNYFVDYTFSQVPSPGDEKWHHDPKIYWPLAGSLDFLAYSSSVPFDEKSVSWDEDNASKGIKFDVQEDHLQDDIVFAAAQGTSAAGANPVAMEFQHAQAWIEFQLKMKDEKMKDILAIKKIEIENIYTTGELSITRSAAVASADWNFRREIAGNLELEDNYNVYGSQAAVSPFAVTNALGKDVKYIDVLLPEQEKTTFLITYVLAGQPNELTYRFTLTGTEKWLMGNKYVYAVTFEVNELVIAPTVTEYVNGSVSDLIPSSLI